MENIEIVNKGTEEVVVMWDGLSITFKPGQKKAFQKNLAEHIVLENPNLDLVGEDEEIVIEDLEDADEVEEPKKVVKVVKKAKK